MLLSVQLVLIPIVYTKNSDTDSTLLVEIYLQIYFGLNLDTEQ